MLSVQRFPSSQSAFRVQVCAVTVTVPAINVDVCPSQPLSPTLVESTTSQTPSASELAMMGKVASGPVNVSEAGKKVPLSETLPLSVENPVRSVSKAEKVPAAGQGSPASVMSTGGAGVKVTVPAFPARVTNSTKTLTPKVDSPAILPDTVTSVVPLGSTVTLEAVKSGIPNAAELASPKKQAASSCLRPREAATADQRLHQNVPTGRLADRVYRLGFRCKKNLLTLFAPGLWVDDR